MCESGIDMEWCDCENAIEWLDGQKTATVTIHSEKLKNRVLKLAEEYPNKVKVIAHPKENHGYLYARVPRTWVKISPPRTVEMSEEERQKKREWAIATNIERKKEKHRAKNE